MENSAPKHEWFADWFDTPYYHILYKNRNHEEAELFVRNLVKHLGMESRHQVLDLACGRGRHAIFLHKLGLDVTGADLSANSIEEAKKSENERLHFCVHDMREPIPGKSFDFIVNLFTSFGYFDRQEENLRVLRSIFRMLNPDGKLVIDFFNLQYVLRKMVAEDTKVIDGIHFHISKRFDGTYIFKKIEFSDKGRDYSFTERVQALTPEDFRELLREAGFHILETFGNFQLQPFDPETSDRFILIAGKHA